MPLPPTPDELFGETLRAVRKHRGDTQLEAARKMSLQGAYDWNTIARWERGARLPTGLLRVAAERYIAGD